MPLNLAASQRQLIHDMIVTKSFTAAQMAMLLAAVFAPSNIFTQTSDPLEPLKRRGMAAAALDPSRLRCSKPSAKAFLKS
jgi:hypothetical protein